jgi:hypothetical protein
MCNAWNHAIGCRCGWGGDGHAGRGTGGPSGALPYANVAAQWYRELFDAYATPNSRCPVCGCKVYFYQSEFGGRVFFDELGPPWPKHPCTDHAARSSGSAHATRASEKWQPLLIESFALIPNYSHCYAVSAQTLSGPLAFFVRSSRLRLRAPFFVSLQPDGRLTLSSIQPYMSGFTTVEVPAWRSLLDAGHAPVDEWSPDEKTDLQLFDLLNRGESRGEG